MTCFQCGRRPALAYLGIRALCGDCWLDAAGPEKHWLRWFGAICVPGICGHPGHQEV